MLAVTAAEEVAATGVVVADGFVDTTVEEAPTAPLVTDDVVVAGAIV